MKRLLKASSYLFKERKRNKKVQHTKKRGRVVRKEDVIRFSSYVISVRNCVTVASLFFSVSICANTHKQTKIEAHFLAFKNFEPENFRSAYSFSETRGMQRRLTALIT